MPKRMRRRLLTPSRKKHNVAKPTANDAIAKEENEVLTPRGRLKGALKEALEPGGDESDSSSLLTPLKRSGRVESHTPSSSSSETEAERGAVSAGAGRGRGGRGAGARRPSPQRYVLKLFDRSVDLSQFEENSPLYPICRAWIANQPRMNYKKFGLEYWVPSKKKYKPPPHTTDSVELPGPVGPVISRIPDLLPEQLQRNKDNINLNYDEAPPPSRAELLGGLAPRWAAVRGAWLRRAARVEARYHHTQQALNRINVNSL